MHVNPLAAGRHGRSPRPGRLLAIADSAALGYKRCSYSTPIPTPPQDRTDRPFEAKLGGRPQMIVPKSGI